MPSTRRTRASPDRTGAAIRTPGHRGVPDRSRRVNLHPPAVPAGHDRRPDDPAALLPAYPLAVDETIARLTAGQVVVLNALALVTRQWWLLALVAGDYAIRAAVGPRFSPLARVGALVARRLNLPARRTPAPPKRFAATIGGTFMITAITLGLVGQPAAAMVVGGVMVLLPAIESILGFCVGCAMFGQLMRLGLVPERVCLACADVRAGLR